MSELIFSLDCEKKEKESFLVIHVSDAEHGNTRIIYADALLRGKKEDRELYTFLLKEHTKSLGISVLSDKVSTVSIVKIRIPPHKSLEAIKLLALSKKLQYKGKSLFYNPFAKTSIAFEAKDLLGALEVCSYITVDGNRSPLSSIQMLFASDPMWCIIDRFVVALPVDIDRRLISLTYPGPLKLEGRKKEDFIELYKDDPDVDILFENNVEKQSSHSSVPLQALPVLQLKDKSGAFASLLMDYGSLGIVAFEDPMGTFRNKPLEISWEKDLLETGFQKKIVGASRYFCPMDQVAKTLSFLLELGWKIIDSQGRNVVKCSSSYLDISLADQKIVTKGKLQYEHHETSLQNVVGAFNRREKFVELNPFSVGLIDPSSMEFDISELAEADLTPEGLSLTKNKVGLLDSFLHKKNIQWDQETKDLVTRMSSFSKEEKQSPSSLFLGELYPYQQEGVSWLCSLYESRLGALLADDMGLGKTVQVLGFLSRVSKERPVLIIAPTSLIFNWRKEFQRFLPSLSPYIHGGKERKTSIDALKTQSVILTSYAYLRIDSALLQKVDFECVILDEAQMIKNPESLVAQSAFLLRSQMRISITGTPVENRWEDLWSLFHFIEPQLLEDKKQFHASMLAAQSDERYLRRVKKKIKPFLLRRTKEDVALDLPDKVLQTVWVEMGQIQRGIYEEYLARNRKTFAPLASQEGGGKFRMQVLEALLRLRQICCHPYLVDKNIERSQEISPKLERVIADTIEVVSEGRKVIIFSQFTEMLQVIKESIQQLGVGYVYLDGSTKDREGVVKAFQEDSAYPVFLMSLKAGGVGLNLTAADYVFLFDPWWNEAAERQAIDRAYRLGRKDTVVARRYVMAESVEEKIMKLKEQKSALADNLLDMDADVSSVSMQDLIAMIQ